MTQQTFDMWTQIVHLFLEFLAVSGLGVAGMKWLQAHGVQVQDLANNKLVGAAERLAPTLLKEFLVDGKSVTDPAVLAQVETAIVGSLDVSHVDSIKAAGASAADLATIAKNAVSGEVKSTLDATAQAASTAVDPVAAVVDAQKLLVAVQAAANPPAPPAAPAAVVVP